MKTKPQYDVGDLVWLHCYPGDCQSTNEDFDFESEGVGPFLVLEVIYESEVLKDKGMHANIDIPAILFSQDHPQWYYILLTEVGTLEIPMREDYLAIFNKLLDEN